MASLGSNWMQLQRKLSGSKRNRSSSDSDANRKKLQKREPRESTNTKELQVIKRVLSARTNSDNDEARVAAGVASGIQSASAVCELIRKGVKTTQLHEACGKETSVIALDCEMVGVGPDGRNDALARISIVDFEGKVLYDQFVRPVEPVTDYRTKFSGIRPKDLVRAIPFKKAQEEVAAIVKGKIVVGHSLKSDLDALMLNHPRRLIRDTAYFKHLCPRGPKKLKHLCKSVLGLPIQDGEHDSVEDARAVLAVYKRVRKLWEKQISSRGSTSRSKPSGRKWMKFE